MVFALSLLLPMLAFSFWLFWRLSPQRVEAAPLRRFNLAAIALALLLGALLIWYVRSNMMTGSDRATWPLVAAFYLAGAIPLFLALAGLVRRKCYGSKEADKPLELTRDLSKTRF
ncbi:MAG: hypothetical protein KF853_01570 [Rhodocyclaceae bacterium]|jgi:uncharacterized membrane protein|nr:hypothetical protein [Rhodocyclaceae bacterium]MCP5296194.1 hypothetical protein [Zoogloeaceae bacterium]PKO72801.1 MAG: hypothetical protein CVU20_00140 [Betaproteobacteria bacterium HGW-Betaproteobacteria-14]MBX3675687.1 hypothetical protein [Rhodocyclaceae bacterium]MBZ0133917.1 hypothetical protein [Rhodocyclaceae bacterium]